MVPYPAALDLPHALVEWVTMLRRVRCAARPGPAVRPTPRPRPRRTGRAGRGSAAARQRRLPHRRLPRRGHPTDPGPAAETASARPSDSDPHRLRRRHPRVRRLAGPARTVAVVLGRHDHHRRRRHAADLLRHHHLGPAIAELEFRHRRASDVRAECPGRTACRMFCGSAISWRFRQPHRRTVPPLPDASHTDAASNAAGSMKGAARCPCSATGSPRPGCRPTLP